MRTSVKRRVGFAAGGLIVSMAVAVTALPAEAAGCVSLSGGRTECTFDYTGGVQQFTVPAGVTSLGVDLLGAPGGDDPHDDGRDDVAGGKGAHVQARLAVTPGQILDVVVGQEGIYETQDMSSGAIGEPTSPAYNGGAPGNKSDCGEGEICPGNEMFSAGGGGATDLRTSGGGLGSRLIVAGGGGGAGADFDLSNSNTPIGTFSIFGHNGGAGGSDGDAPDVGGKAGTNSAGGAGGTGNTGPGGPTFSGTAGTEGSGGIGGPGGGGGGGGLYGGGGGAFAASLGEGGIRIDLGGGGGGASYTGGAGVTEGWVGDGTSEGDGQAVIGYRIDPLTVTINEASGQADPTSSSPIKFDIEFSEAVTGFTDSDVYLGTSTTPGTLVASVTGSGATYTASVTGMSGAGDVIALINDEVAKNAAGNENEPSTSTDNKVTYQPVDPGADSDGDGLTNAEEDAAGTDPDKPDTDGDGLKDGRELDGFAKCAAGTNPLKKDTDDDGLADNVELTGVTLTQKVSLNEKAPKNAKAIGLVKTNPCAKDTDGDKLTDTQEVSGTAINQKVIRAKKYGNYTITTRKTNPLLKDTDKDGASDRQEVTGSLNTRHGSHKSDPTAADTDWGGAVDGLELKRHSDPSVADK